jgi:hypothetical protein
MEIALDVTKFKSDLAEVVGKLEQADPPSEQVYPFTVVVWKKSGEPIVIQVSTKGLKIGDQYLAGNDAAGFQNSIKKLVGEQLFANLWVDRITFEALDLNRSVTLSDNEKASLLQLLKKTIYNPEPSRTVFPLFPYYQLQLDTGGKSITTVDVLTPTQLRVNVGDMPFYYTLPDNTLFGQLKQAFSNVAPSGPVAHLFNADRLSIHSANQKDGQETIIDGEHMDQVLAKSMVHEVVRMLNDAQASNAQVKESPELILGFSLNGKSVEVSVTKNSFIMNGKVYASKGLLDHMRFIFNGEER